MPVTIEIEREEDGRWLAEVPELPGALAYGEARARSYRSRTGPVFASPR